ncbi:WecB/TagA/CpsF family glycosyltransferase [Mangrovicella endophytica]|uniref:WecB/TagA/CpsF family glycosyltransferase n=1 Tax=Mangrovicella endophytica TaxID=2066697 RepID=UPI000C9EBE81|nr:WecB/TagA/CpsF family glycosyltransferase [Mangrovicella endophytica]
MTRRTVDYLGLPFLDGGLEAVRTALQELLESNAYAYVVTPNVDHMVAYHSGDDWAFKAVYADAALHICDSRILAVLAKASGKQLTPCPGSDLTLDLIRRPLKPGIRMAMVGPDEAAAAELRRRFPEADVAHLPSSDRLTVGSADWHATVERVAAAAWDLLFVCLSFPKQEFFAADLKRVRQSGGVALCVGASIDFLTGKQVRAPAAMQRLKLEWLHRLAGDPKRMWRRYLVRGPKIFRLALREALETRSRTTTTAEAATLSSARSAGSAGSGWGGGRRGILFLSTVQPLARRSGGEICSMNFIEALKAAGADVEVLAYDRAGSKEPLPDGFAAPRTLTIESADSKRDTAIWLARAFATRRPFSVQKYVTPQMRRAVRERLSGGRYDAVVFDHAQATWLLGDIPRELPVIFIAHNVEHALYAGHGESVAETGGVSGLRRLAGRAKAGIYRREGRLLAAAEEKAANRASQIWTLTEEDRFAFAALVRDPGKVRRFAVPGQSFGEMAVVTSGADHASRPDIGLLGNWTWDINRAGLDWFLDEVVPSLPASLDIVVGGKAPYPAGTRRGPVRFTGFVPDAGAFLRNCRLIVIPSTIGSGIQIKTIETIGLGVPVVATPVALRGIDERPANVREAGDATAMLAGITGLLAHPAQTDASGPAWLGQRRKRFETDVAAALAALAKG